MGLSFLLPNESRESNYSLLKESDTAIIPHNDAIASSCSSSCDFIFSSMLMFFPSVRTHLSAGLRHPQPLHPSLDEFKDRYCNHSLFCRRGNLATLSRPRRVKIPDGFLVASRVNNNIFEVKKQLVSRQFL